MTDQTRYKLPPDPVMDGTLPTPDLSAPDLGHEGGVRPMESLQGGMASTGFVQPVQGENTAPGRVIQPNATDASSATSGYLAGATWTYNGGA
ncbi:hypothetical protein [Streptomyces sp. NPDC004008]